MIRAIRKFIRKLIIIVILIAAGVFLFKHYKTDISDYLISKGFRIPGITDETTIFPSSSSIRDGEGNLNLKVSIPSGYASSISDDELLQIMSNSEGRIIIERADDGSLDITMSEDYAREISERISAGIDDTVLQGLIEGNILSIDHNEDYSLFTVTYVSPVREADMLLTAGKLYSFSRTYSAFAGTDGIAVRIDFKESGSGEVTNSYSSDNFAEGLTSDAQNYANEVVSSIISHHL